MTFRTKISGQKNWLPRTDSQSTGAACHLETIVIHALSFQNESPPSYRTDYPT